MRELFYVVWQPDTGYTKCRHQHRWQADEEAKRLAAANPGKEFIVLCPVLRAIKDEVVIEHCQAEDHIPF